MITINLNGKKYKTSCMTICKLKEELSVGKDTTVIFNGIQTYKNKKLSENISVLFIKKNAVPALEEYKTMMSYRYSRAVFNKLAAAEIAIAGLGGVGSNAAIMLARTGIGKLLLVDFDSVEPSNLNRQHYFIKDLGCMKVKALKKQIKEINPYIKVEITNIRIKKENIKKIFGKYKIICEAFDNPKLKAMFINTVLTEISNSVIIASNGMAGYFSSNKIKTRRQTTRLYVCGDLQKEVNETNSLFAARVQICAAHLANMAIRLALGKEKV